MLEISLAETVSTLEDEQLTQGIRRLVKARQQPPKYIVPLHVRCVYAYFVSFGINFWFPDHRGPSGLFDSLGNGGEGQFYGMARSNCVAVFSSGRRGSSCGGR